MINTTAPSITSIHDITETITYDAIDSSFYSVRYGKHSPDSADRKTLFSTPEAGDETAPLVEEALTDVLPTAAEDWIIIAEAISPYINQPCTINIVKDHYKRRQNV